ncbi:zinc metalloproteinase nas-4-like [Tubulanus polymorphus]|uniref:zinc metalloproteinase nas-4-like n=1 Tax=Tubulanus polymorphus TaxID=672921 RepID=UPI003DA4B8A4
MILIALTALLLSGTTSGRPNQPIRPIEVRPPTGSLSIDQIIMKAGGGPEAFRDPIVIDNGHLAELDMLLSSDQFNELYSKSTNITRRRKRKAHWELFKRWTNNTIPYSIKPTDVFSDVDKAEIKKAIDEIERSTCIKFVAATDKHVNKLLIQNGAGCNSNVGMHGGEQNLNLAPSCRIKPTILHELGHALGLVHEHQLPDRDEYLNILYENIKPEWKIWFKKLDSNLVLQYGVPYDYRSIMHYGITAFTENGKQTIQAKDITKGHLIQDASTKSSFAFSDVKVINLHYECNSHCSATIQGKCPQPGSFLNKHCLCEHAYGRMTNPLDGAEITPAGPTTTVPCVDTNQYCPDLAGGGACNTDPGFMLENCQVSCGICSLTSSSAPTQPTTTGPMPCLDLQFQCPEWAAGGNCVGYYGPFMTIYCKKSCNFCQTTTTAAAAP